MQANNGSESQPSNNVKENTPTTATNHQSTSTNKVVTAPPVVPAQPWLPMQYPPPPLVMQHGVMPPPHYAPHYMPYHHPHPHLHHRPHHIPPPPSPRHHSGGGSNGENRTIWVGELHQWMNEDYLVNCFASTEEVYLFSSLSIFFFLFCLL